MVNRPKQIGTACETAVVNYLRPNGFPFAERIALHGALDEADVQACPGVTLEVKGGKAAESASDATIAVWLAQAEAERVNRGADVTPLVCKRAGKGAANAGAWWAWLPGSAFLYLARLSIGVDVIGGPNYHTRTFRHLPAVRVTLAELVTLLRRAGYGDPTERSAA